MRLSLLARKLSVKPSVIVNKLLVEGEKPLHGNSKLSEEQIDEIIRIFGPLPEEVEEPKDKKKKKERNDTGNDGPAIQDFRGPLTDKENGNSFLGGLSFTQIGDENFVGLVLSPELAFGKVGFHCHRRLPFVRCLR